MKAYPSALALLQHHLAKSAKILPFPSRAKVEPLVHGPGYAGRSSLGPGSRGGQVVGLTRSGKPIYSHDHPKHEKIYRIGSYGAADGSTTLPQGQAARAMHSSHPRWTHQDHMDAANVHIAAAKADGDHTTALRMLRLGRAHLHAAADRVHQKRRADVAALAQKDKP